MNKLINYIAKMLSDIVRCVLAFKSRQDFF